MSSLKREELMVRHYNIMVSVFGIKVDSLKQIPDAAKQHLSLMSYKSLSDAFIKQDLCNGIKPAAVAEEYGFSRTHVRERGSQVHLNAPPRKSKKT